MKGWFIRGNYRSIQNTSSYFLFVLILVRGDKEGYHIFQNSQLENSDLKYLHSQPHSHSIFKPYVIPHPKIYPPSPAPHCQKHSDLLNFLKALECKLNQNLVESNGLGDRETETKPHQKRQKWRACTEKFTQGAYTRRLYLTKP